MISRIDAFFRLLADDGLANAMPGTGDRARLLVKINGTLSRMNDDQLNRAAKMLKAFVG